MEKKSKRGRPLKSVYQREGLLKANELMIGDWVKFPIGNDKVIDLPYIEGRGVCASFSASATLFPVEVYKLEPIPLTPEILEKNGFVYNESPFVQSWEQFGLSLHLGGDGYRINCGQNVAMVIDSVHQLQHALRFCGIEKEIVI